MRVVVLLVVALGLVPLALAQDDVTIPAGVTRTITWAASHGRECHRYHGRRTCEGPRRVPEPTPEDLARTTELHVTPALARRALVQRPRDEWIAAAGSVVASDLAWPVDGGRIWRGFGIHQGIAVGPRGRLRRTRRRQPHEGVDIGAPAGTAILAANEGLVVYSDNGMSGYGNAVLIVHPDGAVTLYGHCSATFVVAGQHVARGEVIAAVGDTGLAHGAHLHFELHVDGAAVDPAPRFAAPGGPAAGLPTPDADASSADAGTDAADAGVPPDPGSELDAP